MREILLLRWCQAGITLCGLLLIMIGLGVLIPWLHALLLIAVSGAIAGLIHEYNLRRRGDSEGLVPMLLPIAGCLSGGFALLTHF